MKNKKSTIIAIVVILTLLVITTVVWALFTARQAEQAQIKIGTINVTLIEDWPDDVTEYGIERNQKKVCGKSTGDKDAYVRMRFIPIVQYLYETKDEEGNVLSSEWKTASISQDNINIKIKNADDWILQGDYYYYKKILKPGEVTSKIDLEWEIYEMPSEIAHYENIRTDVRVILEYSQTTNDAWKDIFQIYTLPDGVER